VRGTTHERPADRFAQEALTRLDGRPPYAWAHVREHASAFTIWHGETVVATHARQRRHQVVMQPAHYAGLLRVDQTPLALMPPQYAPRYPQSGDVAARDLAVYERFAALGA